MNNTWLIILGVLAAGLAVFLLLPQFLPGEAPVETSVVLDVEPDVATEEEQPVAAHLDGVSVRKLELEVLPEGLGVPRVGCDTALVR